MLVGEFVTGKMAVESKMILANGETVNFTDVSNKVELALTDASDPYEDSVVVVPGSMLAAAAGKTTISDPELPVNVEVLEYMKNSDLVQARPNDTKDVRVSQTGTAWRFVNRDEEKGVDTQQREDAPAARVALRDKKTGEVLGTYLVSVWFYSNFTQRLPAYQFAPQHVTVDGKTYTVALRLKRVYKPYTIELKKFHHDMYPGTDVPKNFSSDIRLVDASHGEDREVKIYMNNPLRYGGQNLGFVHAGGETFYQSGFLAGDRGTVLQVVDNPGAWMPYVSCLLVAVGMLIHFGINLVNFVNRRVGA
jgi:hypothetical protein